MLNIMDVSRWQGEIDWDAVKASGKVDGVMLRAVSYSAAYGGLYVDPTFEPNYRSCVEAGLPAGAYFYMTATIADQAKKELAKVGVALEGKEFRLPIAVDVEDPRLKALHPNELTKLVKMELKQLETWGLYAMMYTYTNFADTALNMYELTNYDLWIADYRGKRPTRKHGMWQYTSKAAVPGVKGNVDMSYAYKNYPAIIARTGLTKLKGV